MPSTATTRNGLELQAPGENNNSWGDRLNDNMFALIDEALDGVEGFTLSGSKTLTTTNYASNEARNRVLNITGGTGGTITIPDVEKVYLVRNASSGNVIITTGSGTTATVTAANVQWVFSAGGNLVYTQNIANFGASNFITTGYAQAAYFRDTNNIQNCQFGNGGLDGGGLSAGKAGSSYVGIGYNVRFSDASNTNLVAPLADTASLIFFNNGVLEFYSWPTGLAGRTITMNATSLVFSIATDGRVTAEGTYNNTTAGSANVIIASTGTMSRATSVRAAKDNIEPMTAEEADKVLQIPCRTYTSKCPDDDPDEIFYGFIADEVDELLPALVSRNADGEPDGVRYERVVVALLDVVKRQQETIEAQDARITALEAA